MQWARSGLWLGGLAAVVACGPRGGGGSDGSRLASVSIYEWGIDEHHGKVTASFELDDGGCYRHESYHPMVGPSLLTSCMPADRARKLLADVERYWAQGGWTQTSYAGPSQTHERMIYVTTKNGKTWAAPTDVPVEGLVDVTEGIERAVLDHHDQQTPSPEKVGPLEFAMVSVIIARGPAVYRADVDTLGRWQCWVPRDFGQRYSFDEEMNISAGKASPETVEALFADLFDGVSFEPAESRSIEPERVELRNFPGDSGRELLPDAAAVVTGRWRERAGELSPGCAVPAAD